MKIFIRKTLSFLLLCVCAIFGCKKGWQEEKENNNLFSEANPIELQKKMTGSLQTTEDVDFFTFTLKDTTVLDISLSGMKGVNNSIKVWKDGNPPAVIKLIDDARKSSPERIKNLTLPRGKYYVSVQHGGADERKGSEETTYELFVESRNFMGSEEIEPNDNFEQATLMRANTEIKGYYSPAINYLNNTKNAEEMFREADFVAVPIDCSEDAPKLLDVSLTGVPGINAALEVYGPDKKLLVAKDANPAGEGEFITGIGLTKAGTWYICVYALGRSSNVNDAYTLSVNVNDYDSSFELEPNDTFATATEMNGGSINGKFGGREDLDYFKFTPDDNGAYRISLQPDATSDICLTLYSGKKEKLAEVNNGAAGNTEVYPNLYIDGECYFLASIKGEPTADSSYTLTVEPVEAAYAMEVEPNDTKEKASKVTETEFSGFTSTVKDKDFFYIPTSGRMLIELAVTPPKKGKIKVSITDPMGFTLTSKDGGNGNDFTLSETIDGSGYIIVDTVKADFDTPYIIRLRAK